MQVSRAGAQYSANKHKTLNLRQGLFCCIIEISQTYRKYMKYCFREGYSSNISSNPVNQENNVLVQISAMTFFFLKHLKWNIMIIPPLLEYHSIYISGSEKCCTWKYMNVWKSYQAVFFFLKHLWAQLESQCHDEKLLLIFSLWMWRAGSPAYTEN